MDHRLQNKYNVCEDVERMRMQKQVKITRKFDQEIYERLFDAYPHAIVLDVGSNDGSLILDRTKCKSIDTIIGLEYNQELVNDANAKKVSNFTSIQCNLESDDFDIRLKSIMDEKGIEKFDIIHLSFICMHLKNPAKILKILREHLSERGIIFIKDIDDGQVFCFPDKNRYFEKIQKISLKSRTSGFRFSGRQIYTMLVDNNYKDIDLVKSGFCTVGLDNEEKEDLFEMNFSFILEDLEVEAKEHTDRDDIQEDFKSLSDSYPKMKNEFLKQNFIYNCGLMIYTAHK